MLNGKVVRVRWMKPYPSAHNHVAIGLVLEETASYLTLNCKTYHFGNGVGAACVELVPNLCVGGIVEGEKSVRAIPWGQIAVINVLPVDTEWDVSATVEPSGLCRLKNAQCTVVTRASGVRGE